MRPTFKSSVLMLAALAASASTAGCVSHRPSRNGVFNENQYVRKDFLVRAGDNDTTDPGWVFKATVMSVATPNPLGGELTNIWPGAENGEYGGSLVRFRVTQDKLEMLNMREISPDTITVGANNTLTADPNKNSEVMDTWGATNVDLKYRVNLDGETTNFYEENQEADWQTRQWLKLNFGKNDLSDVQPFGTLTTQWFQKCTDWTEASTTLVPSSFVVDEDRSYMEWQVAVNVLINYDEAACVESYGQNGLTAQAVGRQNASFVVKYSLVRNNADPTNATIDPLAYEPLVIDEKDPIRHKYGVSDFVSWGRDQDSGQLAAQQYTIRFNPKKDIVWWFDVGFPDRYKPYFQTMAKQTNDILTAVNPKAGKVVFKDVATDVADGDPIPQKGDVRFNMLNWITDKDIQDPDHGWAGVTQWVIDPRTGEILTSSINFNDFAIKDFYVQRLDAYLKSLGACASFTPGTATTPAACTIDVNSPDDPTNPQQWPDPVDATGAAIACTPGASVPILPDYAIAYHNATSSLVSKMQDTLHKSASATNPATGMPYGPLGLADFVPPADPDFEAAYFNVLPYFVFADPDTNQFVLPEGQQGVFGPGEMWTTLTQEAQFHQTMGNIDKGLTPFDSLTGADGVQNAVAFSKQLGALNENHKAVQYSKNFIRKGMAKDAATVFSFEEVIKRDSRHCLAAANGKPAHWETRDEWVQNLIDTYWTQVIWHEFGHTLGLDHNFMGSVDKPNWSVATDAQGNPVMNADGSVKYSIYSNSVMEYNAAPDRVFWTPQWAPYDKGAIGFLYSNTAASHAAAIKANTSPAATLSIDGQSSPTFPWNDSFGFQADGTTEKKFLFCNATHMKYSPFCRQGDLGSTPAEIIANQIENYDWQYAWRNYRTYHKLWNDANYADVPTDLILDLRRFLPLWTADWDEADLIELMRRTQSAVPPSNGWAEAYYESMFTRFNAQVSAANQMVAAFHKSVIQQNSGERPYATTYDPFFGDVSQQGIIIDKLQALNAWTTLWPVDNYSRNRVAGQYFGSFSIPGGDGDYQTIAEDAVESMVGGQYNDVFPYFKPLAVAQFSEATHDINYTGRIEVRDWIGGFVFYREEDFLNFFRAKAVSAQLPECDTDTTNTLATCTYDPRLPIGDVYHADTFNGFIGPDHRRWTFAYVADRNQWVAVDQDRNTASYLIVNQYNSDVVHSQNDGSASSDFGGPYTELLPIKYFLDSFVQYN